MRNPIEVSNEDIPKSLQTFRGYVLQYKLSPNTMHTIFAMPWTRMEYIMPYVHREYRLSNKSVNLAACGVGKEDRRSHEADMR